MKSKDNKTLQMCSFISLLIGLQGYVMAAICYKDSNHAVVVASLIYGTLMFVTFVDMQIRRKTHAFFISGSIMVVFLEVFFLYTGGTHGFGIIWLILVPLFTVYLMTYGAFIALNLIVLLIFIIAMYTPLNKFIYDFDHAFEIRFPLVYIMSFMFSFFLKLRIKKTENELENKRSILSTEISQAAKIQNTFLKQTNLDFKNWDTAYICIPMAGVSGDLFDYYINEKDSTILDGFGIYDISGHGISSGILSLLAKNIFQHEFYENKNIDLWETVQKINDRFILEKGAIDNYITGIIARTQESRIEIVNAGQQLPFLYKKSTGNIEVVKNSSAAFGAIGLAAVTSLFDSVYLDVESGDELILFTDGVTDCRNQDGVSLGRDSFYGILKKHINTQNINKQLNDIVSDIKLFKNEAEAADDMTIILLRKK